MREILAETPDLVTKGLPLLKIFQKLFLPIPFILLPIIMLLIPPGRKLPLQFIDLLHLPSRCIHQDLIYFSLFNMLDHVRLILVFYACCLALYYYVDRAYLGPSLTDYLIAVVFLDQGGPHDAFAKLFTDQV